MQITRKELYDLVWSKPLIHLAREFNLSDVGLSKICQRNQIPRPPSGYWLRLARGYVGKKEPLPSSPGDTSEMIEIQDRERSSEEEFAKQFPELTKEYDRIRGAERKVNISLDVKSLHPLLRKTQSSLRKGTLGRYGRLECSSECVDISVSKELVDRSLLIMDALFKHFDSLGLPISVRGRDGTFVKILDRDIQISLQEKTRRIAYVPNEREFMPPKYSYEPTGVLSFRIINAYSDGIQRQWSDSEPTRLEEKLSEISEGLVRAAYMSRIHEMHLEEKWRKMESAQREEMQKRAQEEVEQKRVQKLVNDAKTWETSQLIRSFVSAVKEGSPLGSPEETAAIELNSWVNWARQQADRMDPILNNPSRIWSVHYPPSLP